MDLIKNIFKGDKVIWIIFLCLCLISIVEVFSAASILTYKTGDHWAPIRQHFIFLMIGAIVVVIMHNIPYKWFQVFPVFLYPISIVMLAIVFLLGLFSGGRINGASRWLSIMGLQFQPSEIAKMAVIITVAYLLSKKKDNDEDNAKTFKYILIITFIVFALIAPENMSTGFLLLGVVIMMMFIGGIAFKRMLKLIGTLLLIAILGITTIMLIPQSLTEKGSVLHRVPTWQNRIKGFANKEKVSAAKFNIEDNAQVAHAHIAIATCNVIGKGPGNSIQRDFLSQAYSDFIYAIIIEELGIEGGIFVVFLYICLLIRVGRIAKECDRTFPAFLVIGISLLLVAQALLNMMVAVGLFPVTGQPLPLVSKGGTSTLVNCIYIGMILSVSRYTAKLKDRRIHDENIKFQIENPPEDSDAQTAVEPTSPMYNNDNAFDDRF
ncbi:MAG: FtsW/RodA/SpoVE family cell cycle protein [Bacteroidaceae bacterium]|nr:FtsW/RodA/SpoVE family cell cycle protein [Bacteroidaceae bacterium]